MLTTAQLERHQRAAQSARNVRDFYDRRVHQLEGELNVAREELAKAEEQLRLAESSAESARAPSLHSVA